MQKNTWYDLLIRFISKTKKMVGGVYNSVISLFETNITNDYSRGTCVKNVHVDGKNLKKLKTENNLR